MPVSEGIVWLDRQQSNGKRNYKKVSLGNLQVPTIILLAFCLAAPDKDGACHCSALNGAETEKEKERQKGRA